MAEEEHGVHGQPRPSEHRKLSVVEREKEWLAKHAGTRARGRQVG